MFGFQRQMGRGAPLASYYNMLRAFPADTYGYDTLEKGNKILLPASALHQIASKTMINPMIFSVETLRVKKKTHVGVLEFIAPEDVAIFPHWLFQVLELKPGEMVVINLVTNIPKGNFIKIQPHQTAFIDLPNPREILEVHLRSFPCLTLGDTIQIVFAETVYDIDILDVKPDMGSHCIITIDADVEVDFAQPLDYVDAPKQPDLKRGPSSVIIDEENKEEEKKTLKPFSGAGTRIDGRAPDSRKPSNQEEIKEEYDPRKHKIQNGIRPKNTVSVFNGKGVLISKTKPQSNNTTIMLNNRQVG